MIEIEGKPMPPKVLGLFSIVMINVIAVISLRSLPLVAGFGNYIPFFYGLAILGFFLPVTLIAAELASGWPARGGMYVWIREAFNKQTAFFVVWIQWLYNLVWFPTILAFLATITAHIFLPDLVNDPWYLLTFCLGVFWATTLLHGFGMRVSSWLSSFGAVVGTLFPIAVLIGLAASWLLQGNVNHLQGGWDKMIPSFGSSYGIFPIVLFTLIGIEMSAVHAQDARDPERNYPRAIVLSTLLIIMCLVLGSLALAVVLSPENIDMLSGLITGLQVLAAEAKMPYLVSIIALLMLTNGFCSVSAWMIGPTKSLQICAFDGNAPKFLQWTNEQGVPVGIMILQGVIFSGLTALFLMHNSVQSTYWLLSTMTAQLALLLYILLFLSAVWLRRKYPDTPRRFRVPGGDWGITLLAIFGVFTCLAAIIIGFIPPQDVQGTSAVLGYESLLVGGMLLGVLPPLCWRRFK